MISKRIACFAQDVWSIFSPMAAYCKSVNLGQGFPNFETPEFVKSAACEAINSNVNQYSPPKGLLRLRTALSQNYSVLFNRELNADSEIIVTAGANEGIFAIFQAFLNDGDEVVLIEPFFDQYAPNVTMSGGVVVNCALKVCNSISGGGGVDLNKNISSKEWKIDLVELEALISVKTKFIVINTPHNPVGKVFTKSELEDIAAICIKHNLLVISDEVYDRLIYDGISLLLTIDNVHVRIATLPGMWERTITVGSAGKSFCATGWRVGWLIGPSNLINSALLAHSRIVFCTNAPLQEAIAIGFEKEKDNQFFFKQNEEYAKRRSYLLGVFEEIGLPCTVPDGSYFILVNIDKLKVSESELMEGEEIEKLFIAGGVVPKRSRDWKICRWLTTTIGVAAIPPSEFYGSENSKLAESYARFCFCKTDETLQAAKERLMKLKEYVV